MELPMARTLRLLVIEDSPADFLLLTRHLRRQGQAADCVRVASTAELDEALADGLWDLVLADYAVPGMDFEASLRHMHQRCPELPVILLSGAVGEERAVELLHQGVADFVLKGHLGRLLPVLQRSLRATAELRARRAAENALRISEERLRLALEGGDLGMWDWDLRTDALVVNARWAAMLGLHPAQAPTNRAAWADLVHPDDLPALQAAWQALRTDQHPALQVEHRLRHSVAGWVWVMSRGKVIERDPGGHPLRACGTHQDTTERRRLEEELRVLAVTDPLTGVYNRRHFDAALHAEYQCARRYARPTVLIMFDLDGFKAINDTHGHDRGDRLLIEVTALVRTRLRKADTLARWGGEEFMILLPETGLTAAVGLAETLRTTLHGLSGPDDLRVSASFGVAEHRPGETLEAWLKRVDDLVFTAKRAGRDRVVVADH